MKRHPFPIGALVVNSAGYTPENVRLVCAALNIARSNLPDSVFLHITVHAGLALSKQAQVT